MGIMRTPQSALGEKPVQHWGGGGYNEVIGFNSGSLVADEFDSFFLSSFLAPRVQRQHRDVIKLWALGSGDPLVEPFKKSPKYRSNHSTFRIPVHPSNSFLR